MTGKGGSALGAISMRGRFWITASLALGLFVGGCAAGGLERLKQEYEPVTRKEKQILDNLYSQMTPVQIERYLSLPTKVQRREYLRALGIHR
jgi:hypothetical protein